MHARNLRLPFGEVDLFAHAPDGYWVLVEVRGRRKSSRLPRHALSSMKLRRLLRLGQYLRHRGYRPLRVELVEVVGEGKGWPWLCRWLEPGRLGFKVSFLTLS